MMRPYLTAVATGLLLGLACLAGAQDDAPTVAVSDTGPQTNAATWECTPGHKIEKRRITLDSGALRYTFLASGCIDPSHGEERPCSEGNFGMPDPNSCNWYWGGFLQVLVNGTNATAYRIANVGVLESGARGSFQIVWAHPDADVGLRLLMLPGGNHVLAQLTWLPREAKTLDTLAVKLTCYPSFFTAARGRTGERHCRTPRTDELQPQTLQLQPEEDTYLYYYDTVFDVAKGEGSGPCAALVAPEGVTGGNVQIGGYAVVTNLNLDPAAGSARLALYDFTGHTNAEAQGYMDGHAAGDLAELLAMDFRPASVQELDADALQTEADGLLADAADDGEAFRPRVEELLQQVRELKAAADESDWAAEAELAGLIRDSEDMFWKLKAFAALNRQ